MMTQDPAPPAYPDSGGGQGPPAAPGDVQSVPSSPSPRQTQESPPRNFSSPGSPPPPGWSRPSLPPRALQPEPGPGPQHNPGPGAPGPGMGRPPPPGWRWSWSHGIRDLGLWAELPEEPLLQYWSSRHGAAGSLSQQLHPRAAEVGGGVSEPLWPGDQQGLKLPPSIPQTPSLCPPSAYLCRRRENGYPLTTQLDTVGPRGHSGHGGVVRPGGTVKVKVGTWWALGAGWMWRRGGSWGHGGHHGGSGGPRRAPWWVVHTAGTGLHLPFRPLPQPPS